MASAMAPDGKNGLVLAAQVLICRQQDARVAVLHDLDQLLCPQMHTASAAHGLSQEKHPHSKTESISQTPC